MEDLDNNWILLNKEVVCANDDDNSPATLGLKNMRGVFIVVGVGILLGLVLIVVEIVYKRHQMGKIKRIAAARKAATKWRGSVEVGDETTIRLINLTGLYSEMKLNLLFKTSDTCPHADHISDYRERQ